MHDCDSNNAHAQSRGRATPYVSASAQLARPTSSKRPRFRPNATAPASAAMPARRAASAAASGSEGSAGSVSATSALACATAAAISASAASFASRSLRAPSTACAASSSVRAPPLFSIDRLLEAGQLRRRGNGRGDVVAVFRVLRRLLVHLLALFHHLLDHNR